MRSKIGPKIPPKITKMKKIATWGRRWFNPKAQLYWCEPRVYKVWKPSKRPLTLWKIGETSHFSLLFSKTWITPTSGRNENLRQREWGRDSNSLSHNSPLILFICENKRLKCSCGLKWKLQLLKSSLVRFQLRRTRHHRINSLLLLFHVISTMMTRATSVVTPPPGLRQNWENWAWLAS
jgi:hypothetical protein